ncbi:ankyrin repeat and SOCS box protein 11 [Osmerus eperlanus]|uniref:ankyrin repeat and SOCS box protein 11 n=1 Tax=Osmerus eperlanus TaxID=29151 RepID=UPI002E0F4194
MAGVQTEMALCFRPWMGSHRIFGRLGCNSLMADWWSDRTPLHDAACQGRLLNLRTLLSQGYSVDMLTMDRVSPLHEACLGGHYACVKFLLESGANVEAVTADGATPLSSACSSGSAACVRLILQYSPVLLFSHQLASPIHEAARKGHSECVEVLLTHGAHIDLQLPGQGTPLYSACLARSAECVERLLYLGADVQLGCGPDSPLHVAVREGGVRVVELLMDYGADGSCRNADRKTPLDLAAANSPLRTTLLSRGPCSLAQACRVSIRRSLGGSRLHGASGLFLPLRLQAFLLYQ